MNPENVNFLRYQEALKDSVIFKNLDSEGLCTILCAMKSVYWPIGTLKYGEDLDSNLHFIVSGRLKEYQINPNTGREHTIFMLAKGDIFDLVRLMDSQLHDINWEAIDELQLLTVSIEDMRRWMTSYPVINKNMLCYLGQRMRFLEEVATDISLHSTLIRLSHLLLNHINEHSHKLEIVNNLPNTEIAYLIGTTRAVVNRHIQELKKCGAISVSRNHIDIENVNLLLTIAEEKYVP